MKKVTKAIIPAAGYGTRFLPATKAVPKEMLPIVDIPSVDYVVEECVESGITDICILLGRGKEAIPNHFDRNFELETILMKEGKTEFVNKLARFENVRFTYIRQPAMRGTGAAIALCRAFVGNDPVAVLFGDDVMYSPKNPVTKQLIDAYETTGATIVGVQELPPERAVLYGVVVPGSIKGRYVELKGFKEKPKITEIPSRYTSLGRFVLTPEIFEEIDRTPPAKNGEIFLPTAIEQLARHTAVYAYNFEGRRYDIGNHLGFLEANIEYGMRHEKIGEDLKKYLKRISETL